MEFYQFIHDALYDIMLYGFIIAGIVFTVMLTIPLWKKLHYIITTPKAQREIDWLNSLPPIKFGNER